MQPILEEEDENAENVHYASRRAKALGTDQKAVAQIEAQKQVDHVLSHHDALDAKSAKASQRLTKLLEDRASQAVDSADADVPLTVRKDHLEAAALADLIIEQHTQLKRAQVLAGFHFCARTYAHERTHSPSAV